MGKTCENWGRFEVPQEQPSVSNHQCPYRVACLRKGSENPIPLAQPLLHRAEQSHLTSFITSLENDWIQVFLSSNEHESVPKTIIFLPAPRTASCFSILFGMGEEKSMEARTESNESGNKTQIIRWQGLIYWKESWCFIAIRENTGLPAFSTNLIDKEKACLNPPIKKSVLCSAICGHLKVFTERTFLLLLCRIPSKEPQVACQNPETKYSLKDRQCWKKSFFLSSKLLCPCQHLSLAKKESYPIFCPMLALPRNEGCLPKAWGSWPGKTIKGTDHEHTP